MIFFYISLSIKSHSTRDFQLILGNFESSLRECGGKQ